VALLISLRASVAGTGLGTDASVAEAALMAEPLGRPGAKRRARCRSEAWKVFGRLLQEVMAPYFWRFLMILNVSFFGRWNFVDVSFGIMGGSPCLGNPYG
jgi:hypothetical protein